MNRSPGYRFALVAMLGALLGGCAADEGAEDESGDAFSSAQATLLTFDFKGEVVIPTGANARTAIKNQLLYSIGQLNERESVPALGMVALSDVVVPKQGNGDGTVTVSYRAVLPVAWHRKTTKEAFPTTFPLMLPRKVSTASLQRFIDKYKYACVDNAFSDVDAGNYWFHYRPEASACKIDRADVATPIAKIYGNSANSKGKAPEYARVWDDNELKVVAVFSKFKDNATGSSWDPGIDAYNDFLAAVPRDLGVKVTTVPAIVPHNPGMGTPDVTFSGAAADGRKVTITALLIDSPKSATEKFNTRYAALTKDADVLMYSGHAGLGANVRALAEKGTVVPGKYQILFLNACDSFAYLDGRFPQRRSEKNPDDPNGTKYLDIVANAMPALFASMPKAAMAVISGLWNKSAPKTYLEMFEKIDKDQVVLVTGDEDNP